MELFYFKQRIKKLNPNYPFSVNPNVVLFLLIAMGQLYVLIPAFFLSCFLQDTGYKPMFKLLTSYAPVEPTTDHDRFQIFVQLYHATHPDKLDQSSSLGVTSWLVIKQGAHLEESSLTLPPNLGATQPISMPKIRHHSPELNVIGPGTKWPSWVLICGVMINIWTNLYLNSIWV